MVQLFAAEGVSLDDGSHPRHHTARRPDPGPGHGRGGDSWRSSCWETPLALSDGGGGVTTYQNENGSAVFRSDGTFDVVIDTERRDSGHPVPGLLPCLPLRRPRPSPWRGRSGSCLRRPDLRRGAGGQLHRHLLPSSGGRVASVSGTHLPQEGQSASGDGALSALGALNAFLGTVQSGAVVTAVTDLYLCYELQSTTATPMALVPAWCIVTDTAELLCELLHRLGVRRVRAAGQSFSRCSPDLRPAFPFFGWMWRAVPLEI